MREDFVSRCMFLLSVYLKIKSFTGSPDNRDLKLGVKKSCETILHRM